MSLILEALRKSEAERRRGATPTLTDESAWAARPRPTRAAGPRWQRWAAIAITVLVAAGAAAWFGWHAARQAERPAAGHAASAPTETASGAAPAAAPADDGQAAARSADTGARPVAAATVAVAAAPVVAPVPDAPAPAATDAGAGASTGTAPPVDAAGVTAAADAGAAAPVETAPDAAPVVAPTATEPALPLLWELPAATRQALPPLKLAMHVWSADPTRRFVLVGETRAAEGERIGSEVVLRAIEPDGAVFEFRGQRFRVPR